MRRALLGLVVLGLLGACHVAGPERFVVYFSPWSSDLDASAKQVVATVAERARQRPGAHVTIDGYASPVGPVGANNRLSENRAQAVTALLMADGVPASRIGQHALGVVDYTLDPIESRRVEILLGEQ